jgi:hypothetical protein
MIAIKKKKEPPETNKINHKLLLIRLLKETKSDHINQNQSFEREREREEPQKTREDKDITGDKIHITRDNALIVTSIIILSSFSRQPCPMSAIVDKQHVSRLGRANQILQRLAHVSPSWLCVRIIRVYQDSYVIFRKTITINKTLVHPLDIIYAAFELSFCSWVVAAYQQCLLCHGSVAGNDQLSQSQLDLGSSDPWRVLSVPFNSDVLDCEKSGIVKEMVMMSCQDSGGFIYLFILEKRLKYKLSVKRF